MQWRQKNENQLVAIQVQSFKFKKNFLTENSFCCQGNNCHIQNCIPRLPTQNLFFWRAIAVL